MTEAMQRYAMIFPGQGSQKLAMLSDLAPAYPQIQQTFREVSDLLGVDYWAMTQADSDAAMNQTQHTQPLMLAADVAVWRAWQASVDVNATPAYMAGHSLGEYSALVCAGALSLSDASRLVALRAKLMQQASAPGEGAMAAVLGLSDEQVQALCVQCREQDVLSVANFNSIGQVVVAGHSAAVARLLPAAKEQGAKLVSILPVSVPSHCELMESAVAPFSQALDAITWQVPAIPVVHNVDVAPHTEPAEIKRALLQQLTGSVRWVESIQYLKQQGISTLVECGPGQVLSKLNRRIDKTMQVFSTNNLENLLKAAKCIGVK